MVLQASPETESTLVGKNALDTRAVFGYPAVHITVGINAQKRIRGVRVALGPITGDRAVTDFPVNDFLSALREVNMSNKSGTGRCEKNDLAEFSRFQF
jgi:hypothetical protein